MIAFMSEAQPSRLIKAGAANQVRKSRIGSDGVEVLFNFEKLQNIRLLLVSLLKPLESPVVFAKPQISIHKRASGNITCLLALLQFREEPQSIPAAPGVRIGPDQHAGRGGAAFRDRDRLFQNRDCISGLIV